MHRQFLEFEAVDPKAIKTLLLHEEVMRLYAPAIRAICLTIQQPVIVTTNSTEAVLEKVG